MKTSTESNYCISLYFKKKSTLFSDKKTWKYLTYKSKLTSVNCASHYDLHNYDGPHLPDSFLTEHLPVQVC
jgi:hypothetical protein